MNTYHPIGWRDVRSSIICFVLNQQPLPCFLTTIFFFLNIGLLCAAEAHSPLLEDLQCEMQQLSLALFSPLDHFQDGDGSAEVPAQLQHLLVGRLIILTVLNVEGREEINI